ncbi:Rha family transcriptional regulator [Aeromonas hydrophila]|uniref:Rha family transcriptional regulator n=1 Tax=Aeromonas hydrophila TaxID=644 RepID=UPI003EC590EB
MNTITTIKLAEIMKREHKNIMRFAKKECQYTEGTYKADNGRMQPCYVLNERQAMHLVANYGSMNFIDERIVYLNSVMDHFEMEESSFNLLVERHRESVKAAMKQNNQ